MKAMNTFKYAMVAVVGMLPLLFLTACKKETKAECSGAPTITGISATTDRSLVMQEGNLSDWIIIHGTNLCGTKQILFNDVEDSLKAAFITATEITLAVPRGIPSQVNNKITVVTPGGSAEYSFKVNIPALEIYGMNNEYIPADSTMIILGKNFDLYNVTPEGGKVLFGNTEAAIVRANGDSVFVTVPAGTPAQAKLQIKDGNGVMYPVPGQYKDARGMIFNYDPYQGVNGITISHGPSPAPVSGNYALLKGNYGAWEWNENYHTMANVKLASLGITGPVSNYLIKFEINVMSPWQVDPTAAWNFDPLKFDFSLSNGNTYEYAWAPFSSSPFTTLGWKTITIPLSSVVGGGNAMPDINGSLGTDDTFVRFFIHGGYGTALNMAWDNFRIVPKDQ